MHSAHSSEELRFGPALEGLPTFAAADREGIDGLTRRELEVLGLLAAGLTNRDVAARLVLSEHTVHRLRMSTHSSDASLTLGEPGRPAGPTSTVLGPAPAVLDVVLAASSAS